VKKLILFLLLTSVILTGCGSKTPERLVQSELELIKKLDEKTILNFISYEDIVRSQSRDTDIGEETTKAVKLFFQNFDYEILSSSVSGDTARVTAKITNLDTKALSQDLCIALIKESVHPQDNSPLSMNSYFAIMHDVLSSHTYELKTSEATFELTHFENGWSIQNTDELEDALVSGLITNLGDPYLITPGEVASAMLDVFSEFTADDWISYLDMQDVFSIGSEISDQVDRSLANQIATCFHYELSQLSIDGDKAIAYIDITSLDMASVLSVYQEKLLAYADTTSSVRASETELANQSATFLKEALDGNTETILRSVPVTFQNDGSGWEMTISEDFIQVLLGDAGEALETFQ